MRSMAPATTQCPGCGLQLPEGGHVNEGYYNASPECLSLYNEVLGTEFGHLLLFSQAHQLTVDTYAVQHAGANHKDKSVSVHLVGLHLSIEQEIDPREIARYLQRLATRVQDWPHFEPPDDVGSLTVFDIAMADIDQHVGLVRKWADQLWSAWQPHHDSVRALAELALAAH
jgi:hypothetical protein